MKTIFFSALITASIAMTSCTGHDNLDTPDRTNGTGTLVLDIGTGRTPQIVSRAIDNDLCIDFICPDGSTYKSFPAGQVPQKVTLEAGIIYTIHAYTPNQDTWQTANAGKGEACYWGETTALVGDDQTVYLRYRVPMTNCAVTFTLPELFDDLFKTYAFTVKCADRSFTLSTQGDTYFIPATQPGFSYMLQATNNDDISNSLPYADYNTTTQSGKLYNVTYKYSNQANTGNVKIDYDDDFEQEEIEVDLPL